MAEQAPATAGDPQVAEALARGDAAIQTAEESRLHAENASGLAAAMERRLAGLEARVNPSQGQVAFSTQPDGWTFGATIGPAVDALSALQAAGEGLMEAHPEHRGEIEAAFGAAGRVAGALRVVDERPLVVSAYGHRQGDGYALNVAVHVPPGSDGGPE